MAPKMQRTISYVKRQFQFRKPICPFISSTFQDFQVERDILVKRVFPRLNALCQSRGTYCAPVDLRWGISDSQANSGRVVQLCLNYIDRCAPFFICLLGERYGTHRPPDAPDLRATAADLPADCHWMDRSLVQAAQVGYDWLLDAAHQHCSVTELEVVHAALRRRNQFARFYFRRPEHVDALLPGAPAAERARRLRVYEAESEASRARVRQLKAQIAGSGLIVHYFTTPEELAALVMRDWREIVDSLYPPLQDFVADAYSERFTEWMAHETFAETRRQTFVSTPEIESIFDELTQFALTSLEEPENDLDAVPDSLNLTTIAEYSVGSRNRPPPPAARLSTMVLTGERGCGKTSILANWLQQFSAEHGERVKVFAHYVGSSALSTDRRCFMRRCTVELREDAPQQMQYAETDDDDAAGYHRVCEEFLAALSLNPCVIIIDGIDELRDSDGLTPQKTRAFLRLLPPQCRVVASVATTSAAAAVAAVVAPAAAYRCLSQRADARFVAVPPLATAADKLAVLRAHLVLHCKCLDGARLRRVAASRLSSRPLFLAVLSSELRVCGAAHSSLDAHLDTYLRVSSVAHLWVTVIQRWVADYSWTTARCGRGGGGGGGGGEEGTAVKPLNAGGGGWVADALRLLAVSRHGLSQTEVLDILSSHLGYTGDAAVTSFEWALFRCAAIDSLFERPAGLLNFFHQQFKDAVEYSLLGCVTPMCSRYTRPSPTAAAVSSSSSPSPSPSTPTRRQTYHQHLAAYFYGQPHSRRRAEELPWHLQRGADSDTLCRVLADTRVFHYMYGPERCCMNSRRLDLIQYWKVLSQAGYSAAHTYRRMMHALYKQLANRKTRKSLNEDSDDESYHICKNQANDLQDGLEGVDCDDCSQMALASLANKAGQLLSVLQHFEEAESMLLKAHATLEESLPLELESQKLLCGLEESIAHLYHFQLKKQPAKAWYLRALASTDSLLSNTLSDTDFGLLTELKGRVLDHLGHMNTFEKEIVEAEKKLSKAYRCMESCGSLLGMAGVLYHIGFLRMNQTQYELAEKCYRDSMSITERWCGKSHPHVGDILDDLARLHCNPATGNSYDLAKAEILYRRALHIREQVFGSDHILVATTLFHLGKMLMMVQRHSLSSRTEALSLMRRALDIRTTKLGCDHDLTRAVERVLRRFELSPHRLLTAPGGGQGASSGEGGDSLPALRPAARTARTRRKPPDNDDDDDGREHGLVCDEASESAGFCVSDDNSRTTTGGGRDGAGGGENGNGREREGEEGDSVRGRTVPVPNGRGSPSADGPYYCDNFSGISRVQSAAAAVAPPLQARRLSPRRPATAAVPPRRAPDTVAVQPRQRLTPCHAAACATLAGPNTSLLSLLTPRPAVSRQLVHAAAWYQVPGRYSTVQQPYPPKRSQRRIALQPEALWPPAGHQATAQLLTNYD